MHITPEAKAFISELLLKQNKKGVRIKHSASKACACGVSPFSISFGEPKEGEATSLVEGILLFFAKEIESEIEHLTLTYDNQRFLLHYHPHSSCTADQLVASLEDVTWKRQGKLILDQVTWQIKKGEHWVVIGLNGSGKTSILSILTGYQWPSTGTVELLGHRLGGVDIRELRKRIGWVSSSLLERFQTHAQETVLDVILSGKAASIGLYDTFDSQDREKARSLTQAFGVERLANEPFRTLSQGERQKVMLARAWMAEPELLILDEPCSGLDIRSREELLQTLEQLVSQEQAPTLLYVTHHIEEMIPSMSHALLVKDGRVVGQGDKHQVLTNKQLTHAFDIPVSIYWQYDRPWISVDRELQS